LVSAAVVAAAARPAWARSVDARPAQVDLVAVASDAVMHRVDLVSARAVASARAVLVARAVASARVDLVAARAVASARAVLVARVVASARAVLVAARVVASARVAPGAIASRGAARLVLVSAR
jgi:hypothetical protein